LVLSLTAGAAAATHYIITSATQISPHALAEIRQGAKTAKVARGPRGPQGPAGPMGPGGPAGKNAISEVVQHQVILPSTAVGPTGPEGARGAAGPEGGKFIARGCLSHGSQEWDFRFEPSEAVPFYAAGCVVTYAGQKWLSLAYGNHENKPDTSPGWWEPYIAP
jgi:hypothetical protein